jgi:hypothetical protein
MATAVDSGILGASAILSICSHLRNTFNRGQALLGDYGGGVQFPVRLGVMPLVR